MMYVLLAVCFLLSLPLTADAQEPAVVVDLVDSPVSNEEEFMFTCLQGLANREAPRVYLHLQKSDPVWLAWYEDHYGLETKELKDPYQLFAAGDWDIDGYVLIDPEALHTMNLAATYCSIDNLLPVSQEILQRKEMPDLPVKQDLRGKFQGWSPKQVYQWSLENLYPAASKEIICNLDIPTPEVRPIFSHHHIRDFAVARRAAFLGLSSNQEKAPEEFELKAKFFDQLDRHAYVTGWHMERDREPEYVRQATKHNLLTLCSSDSSNFSFHRFMKNKEPFRQEKQPNPKEVKFEKKIYLSFIYSDGDSLNHFARGHGYSYFHDRRGEVAMGWEVQPLLADVAPGMLEYFYHNATEKDSFIPSASGLGYAYPEHMPEDDLRDLLAKTKPYFGKLDAKALMLLYDPHGPNVQIDPALRKVYVEELGDTLDAVFEGYWETEGKSAMVDDVVWMVTDLPYLMGKDSETKQIINRLEKFADASQERPAFVSIHLPKGHMNYANVLEIGEALDDRFEIVLPEVLAEGYRRYGNNPEVAR